jgi:hypothetical protein
MKYAITLFTMLFAAQMFATEPPVRSLLDNRYEDDMQTLFDGDHSFGAFIGFGPRLTEFNSQAAMMVGGEINVIFDRSLNIGLAGYGLVSDVYSNTKDEFDNPYYLEIGYGGINVEPILFSKKLIHVSFPVLLGAGGVAETNYRLIDTAIAPEDQWDFSPNRSDFFLVAEPGINAEINVTRFMRVTGGVSYRFVSDVQIPELSKASLDGMSANLSLRFGWF